MRLEVYAVPVGYATGGTMNDHWRATPGTTPFTHDRIIRNTKEKPR
ncbi:hypothetical protein [Nonomuraea diastatica]|nr:hypothetical protein [Nonomuraea diastatica]